MFALSPTLSRSIGHVVTALLILALLISGAARPAHAWWGGTTIKGSGKIVQETRAVTGFDAIELHGGLDTEVRQTGKEGVTLIGDDNIVPLITTEVRERTLIITLKGNFYTSYSSKGSKLRAIVDVAQLQKIGSKGAGDISAKSISAKALAVAISGSGDVRLEGLTADSLNVTVSGSGDVFASGKVTSQRFAIAGSGDVRADALEGEDVTVTIAGSGDARVWSKQSINASVAGSGDVRYRGSPTQVNKRVAGSGEVSPL